MTTKDDFEDSLHVRIVDASDSATVQVRWYTTSRKTGLQHCSGTIRVSRRFCRFFLIPILESGAASTGHRVTVETERP